MDKEQTCQCGSTKRYGDCCSLLHQGEHTAVTAEELMRSRYSAYVLKLDDYVLHTWHSSTRPVSLELSHDDTKWQHLRIIDTEQGKEDDETGMVEFAAIYTGGQLHERSRFVREAGRWFYVDGEILPPVKEVKAGRNEPCPCGSGKKFKKCCGA